MTEPKRLYLWKSTPGLYYLSDAPKAKAGHQLGKVSWDPARHTFLGRALVEGDSFLVMSGRADIAVSKLVSEIGGKHRYLFTLENF